MKVCVVLFLLLSGCARENALESAQGHLNAGRVASAEKDFRRFLDSHPDSVEALYGLGWVYHLSGKPGLARDHFMRCLRVDSGDYRGHKGLGALALEEGNFTAAQTRFRDALGLLPDDPTVLHSMAQTYMGLEDYPKAIEILAPLVERVTERGEFGLNLALSYSKLRQSEQALEVIESSLKRKIRETRFRAMLHELRARVLVRMTSGRLDPSDCANTQPALLETLKIAEKDVESAGTITPDLPTLNDARLRIHRRRGRILEDCPLEVVNSYD